MMLLSIIITTVMLHSTIDYKWDYKELLIDTDDFVITSKINFF